MKKEKNIWLIYQQSFNFAPSIQQWDMKKESEYAAVNKGQGATGFNEFLDGIKGTLFFQMHRINLIMFRLANKHLIAAEIPIKSEQIPVLISIYKGNNISQQEVANIIHRDKSSVQRTVIILQKKGLITIHPDKQDKRRNILSATKKGIAVAGKIGEIVRNVETEIMGVFDAEEALNNIQSLKTIADNLEQIHKFKY